MLADASVLKNGVADTEDDRRNLNADIILCSEVLHSFIDTNTQGEELYGRHHVQGLYVFLDWGSYEIPIFWWLKLVISKWVYRMRDSQQIQLADLESDIPIVLAAFDGRIGIMTAQQPLELDDEMRIQDFWSRVNANELEIFEQTQQQLALTLSKKITLTLATELTGGCIEKFTVDDHKLRQLRIIADQKNQQQRIRDKKFRIEDMMHAVFMPAGGSGGGSAADSTPQNLWHDGGGSMEVSKKALQAYAQYKQEKLLNSNNGLDSLLKFDSGEYLDFASIIGSGDLQTGFLHYVLTSMLTNTGTLDQYSPLHLQSASNKIEVGSVNGKMGIKILDFDVQAVLDQLSTGSSEALNLDSLIEDYLAAFDRVYETQPVNQPADTDPGAVFRVEKTAGAGERGNSNSHCIADKHDMVSLAKQSDFEKTGIGPHVELTVNGKKLVRKMCTQTPNVQFFGHTHPLADGRRRSSAPDGGRCTLLDLRIHGPHEPFSTAKNTKPNTEKILFSSDSAMVQNKQCFQRQDSTPPRAYPPVLDTSHGNTVVYTGSQYMAEEDPETSHEDNGLCIRIDSGCVTEFDKETTKSLFGFDGTLPNPHPVHLKYRALESNAHNQVNGHMWKNLNSIQKETFRARHGLTKTALPDDLYDQNLDMWDMLRSAPQDELFSSTDTRHDSDTCGINSLEWSDGLDVRVYVLNPKIPKAEFSHVMYNDRVLLRRKYTDSTEQQLFGHHFMNGDASRAKYHQITAPTPLFSHCPGLADKSWPAANNYLHHFRTVKVDHGKHRMHERFHRFDQKIFLTPDMSRTESAKITQTGMDGYANDQLRLGWSLVCESLHFWWGAGDFFSPSNDYYRARAGMFLLFFKTNFRWMGPDYVFDRTKAIMQEGSVTRGPFTNGNFKNLVYEDGVHHRMTVSTDPEGEQDCFQYKQQQSARVQNNHELGALALPPIPCENTPQRTSMYYCTFSNQCFLFCA